MTSNSTDPNLINASINITENHNSSLKSLRKKKEKNSNTKFNEILYDPYSSKQDFKNAYTSNNSKSTSEDKKKKSDFHTNGSEKGTKSKKRHFNLRCSV